MSALPQREYTALPMMAHQRLAARKAWGKSGFALLMEQGTGKTLTFIAEAIALYAAGKIEGMLVLAPNGVHVNWVLDEIPKSVPHNVPMLAAYYSTHPSRKERTALDALLRPRRVGEVPPLRIMTMSYDSLLTARGMKAAEAFVRMLPCYIVADESHKIKSIDAKRTKRAIKIAKACAFRRIGTGTAIANSPMDAYSQFEFLGDGLLGETSITAFRSQYCELLPPGHGLMRHIVDRQARSTGRKVTDAQRLAMEARMQIVAKDSRGQPKYKNLGKLHDLVAQHSFRVLKDDCLDLPPKVYETRYFHLTPAQREVYDRMEEEQRFVLEDNQLLITTRLVALGKLRQITSGFLLLRDGTVSYIEDNPRIVLLRDQVEDETQQGIIWSQYKEEQRNIAKMLKALGQTVETVNGETPLKLRREIRTEFQAGNLQWINAHPATMGEGYTLTAGKIVYYYSNGYNLVERLQSEDRTHRKGTTGTIVSRDIVAIDTRDDNVVWALQHKLDTAAMITGDSERKSMRFRMTNERENGA